jgi:DNA-directed RNA polymerase-3 subunit RPC5
MELQSTLEDDPDPIVSQYNIYVKPRFRDGKKVYILQFPNRDSKQAYSVANSSLPLELRIKEKSGLLELDVPVDAFRNYDREKGIKWGEAVRKSDQLKGGDDGSLGLAGGFGIGGGQSTRPRSARQGTEDEGITQEALMRDFAASVAQGRVLRKQTLGGQTMPKDSTTPQYMIGAFRDRKLSPWIQEMLEARLTFGRCLVELHLTPVNQVVQLRPQFHHIDAQTELERRQSREPTAARGADPRAIHMTVKPTVEGEEETTDTMAIRIRAVQEESWQKFKCVDEDSIDAWELFNDSLFVEGKDALPNLVSPVTNSEYLNTISAPRAPAKLAKLEKLRKKA